MHGLLRFATCIFVAHCGTFELYKCFNRPNDPSPITAKVAITSQYETSQPQQTSQQDLSGTASWRGLADSRVSTRASNPTQELLLGLPILDQGYVFMFHGAKSDYC
jgi:hypothetical protein